MNGRREGRENGRRQKEELSDSFRNEIGQATSPAERARLLYIPGPQLVTAGDSGPITLIRLTRAIQSANFRAADCVRAALLRARATRDQSMICMHAARRASPSGISMEDSWTDLAPSSRQRKFDLACAASRSARLAAVDVNIWTMKLRCEFLRERERERELISSGLSFNSRRRDGGTSSSS